MVNTFQSPGSVLGNRVEIIDQKSCERCGSIINVVQRYKPDGESEIVKRCKHCADIELQKEQEQLYQQREEERSAYIFREYSLIPDDLLNATFESYDPQTESQRTAQQRMQKYAENFEKVQGAEKNSILLTGPFGTGKSHLAYCAARRVREKGFRVLFITAPGLLKVFRGTYQNEGDMTESRFFKLLHELDLLVIDDFGAEYLKDTSSRGSEEKESWAGDKIFNIINDRSGAPCIYTTNMNSQQTKEKYGGLTGGRIASRMMNKTELLKVEGEDYRLGGW